MDNRLTGIVTLAIGHPMYYGLARNLVATIRAYDSTVNIAVLTDRPERITIEPWLNVKVIQLPEEAYRKNGQQNAFRTKLLLNKYTPFKKTLYLDVDMAWLYRHTEPLFAELDGKPFTVQNNAPGNACIWANTDAMRQAYGKESPVYHLFSECMYFEKSKEVDNFFKVALKAFDEPAVKTINWAGGKASDEFAFIAAIMQTGIKPHKDGWHPIFWYHKEKTKQVRHPQYLTNDFFAYSIGGNRLPDYVGRYYNIIVRAAFEKLGLQYPYAAQEKRRIIPERKNI